MQGQCRFVSANSILPFDPRIVPQIPYSTSQQPSQLYQQVSSQRSLSKVERVGSISFHDLEALRSNMTDRCARCNAPAYHVERVLAVGKTWHKSCLTCSAPDCNKRLDSHLLVEHDDQVSQPASSRQLANPCILPTSCFSALRSAPAVLQELPSQALRVRLARGLSLVVE